MSFSLKPHQLVAHWIPGFVLLAILFLADGQNHQLYFGKIAQHLDGTIRLLAVVAIGFVVGLFLDAFRDLCEWVWDRIPKWRIGWDFILEVSNEKLQRVEDFYFTYYVFNANTVLALLIALAINAIMPVQFPWSEWSAIVVASIIFLMNAITLRVEIVRKSAELLNEVRIGRRNEKTAS